MSHAWMSRDNRSATAWDFRISLARSMPDSQLSGHHRVSDSRGVSHTGTPVPSTTIQMKSRLTPQVGTRRSGLTEVHPPHSRGRYPPHREDRPLGDKTRPTPRIAPCQVFT